MFAKAKYLHAKTNFVSVLIWVSRILN